MQTTTTMNKQINTMILCFMFIITVLLGSCSARVYIVGDSEGWTTNNNSYHGWFRVGHSLVFEYNRTFINNDVTQVSTASQYELCNSYSPKAVYNTGFDIVTLREPGYHYFITSNYSRCASGQKLHVLVIEDSVLPDNLPLGKNYRVGDSRGWSVYDSEYYYNWAKDKEFFVGDALFFQYRREKPSDGGIYVIRGGSKTCERPDSYLSFHSTGKDLIWLMKPGVHYFISSNMSHCQDGLNLEVVVQPRPGHVTPKELSPLELALLRDFSRHYRLRRHH